MLRPGMVVVVNPFSLLGEFYMPDDKKFTGSQRRSVSVRTGRAAVVCKNYTIIRIEDKLGVLAASRFIPNLRFGIEMDEHVEVKLDNYAVASQLRGPVVL
jgi:hypothetical protein